MKIDNKSFEIVEQDRYLGTTLKIKVHVEIKSRLISENVCYHSAQSIFPPGFYPKYKDKYIPNHFCLLICTGEKLEASHR